MTIQIEQAREDDNVANALSWARWSAAAIALPAIAQDAYVIGVTGALTGPPASTNAPPIEGLRLYVDRLNAAGGINGKKIQLVMLDDQAEPSKAAANAKRLLTQDNVKLLVLSSLSSTYAPVIAETKRANVPLLFMGAVCPKEVYPPADALQFCTTAYARRLRQPRHARLRQGDRQGAGADRLCRHGDPALARRDRLRRGAGQDRWA